MRFHRMLVTLAAVAALAVSASAQDKQANVGAPTPAVNSKVNAQTTHYGANRVDQRRKNQQQRIGKGIENGSLKPGEAAKLEKKEAALNKEIRTGRAANGGKLTPAEKVHVTAQQNKLSKQIAEKKHN